MAPHWLAHVQWLGHDQWLAQVHPGEQRVLALGFFRTTRTAAELVEQPLELWERHRV